MKTMLSEKTKKLSACLLAAIMLVSLAACGNGGKDNETQGGNAQNGQTQVNDTVSIDTVHQKIKEAYGEDYFPDMMLSEDEIQAYFGIEPEWCEEFIAEIPMISVRVDTLIAIKAKKEYVTNVIDAVNAYAETLKNDTMQYPSNLLKIQASTVLTMDPYVFFIMLGTISMEEEEQEDAAQVEAYKARNQVAIDTIEDLLLK